MDSRGDPGDLPFYLSIGYTMKYLAIRIATAAAIAAYFIRKSYRKALLLESGAPVLSPIPAELPVNPFVIPVSNDPDFREDDVEWNPSDDFRP
jgi:hypothetical protein